MSKVKFKMTKYDPLQWALKSHTDDGWKIEIVPWIVGIRGFVHQVGIQNAMRFLEIPTSEWNSIEKCTSKASVESLAFMHRTRFSSGTVSAATTNDPTFIETVGHQDAPLAIGSRLLETGQSESNTFARWEKMRRLWSFLSQISASDIAFLFLDNSRFHPIHHHPTPLSARSLPSITPPPPTSS